MARAPFQVIVFPFVESTDGEPLYAVFRRREMEMWQAVSGGGEGAETPLDAARRETREETGIDSSDGWVRLDAQASIPSSVFGSAGQWPLDLFVVPEYAFGVRVAEPAVTLSAEHRECAWLPFDEAHRRLTWDSNRVALWELNCRVRGLSPREAPDPAITRLAGT
ncbi:MAG: NUDIX domain-containing protein [Vicinamibacterales bacterium]